MSGGAESSKRSRGQTSGPASLEQGLSAVLAASDLTGNPVGQAPEGKEVTAVIVFASWCQPCRNEIALLGDLAAAESRLRIIGVNYYEEFEDRSDRDRLSAFLHKNAPWLQVVRADDELFGALGRPAKVPTLFLFDKRGKLVQSYVRAQRSKPPTRAEIEQDIARALP